MIRNAPPPPSRRHTGFTLVELAIVLVVVSLLAGGLLLTLSGQRDLALDKDAQQQLEVTREALLGFALSNGRLPCPADPTLTVEAGGGKEAFSCAAADCSTGDRTCSREHGVIPWQTLGIRETDPWGSRLTYFVGREFANPLTKSETDQGSRTRFTLDTTGRANIQDGAGHDLASAIPAVIVSHGSRPAGAYQGSGAKVPGGTSDEQENADADLAFVSRTRSDDFDDLVTWIVPTVLKSRMVAVGRLP